MATSPIYSWPEPDNTDLVKNGALAIRTLGDAIDTTMGTMVAKTIVDAKGDLIAATAADTVARLAVGANNTVLTADSSTATGLKWATPATASFVGCSLTKSAAQSIPNATETVITFDTESFDTDAFHSTSTNTGRITIPSGKAGKYLVTAQIMSNSATFQTQGGMRKNGSSVFTYYAPKDPVAPCVLINMIIDLAVADYLEIFVYQGSGVAKDVLANSYTANATIFSAQYLGA